MPTDTANTKAEANHLANKYAREYKSVGVSCNDDRMLVIADAERIEIPASITAVEFYRKKRYEYKNGLKELDDEQHYRLEKFRRNS